MSFTQAIQSGFQNYANFEGRSSRSAYWYWALFAFLLGLIPSMFDVLPLPLQTLLSLALLLPGLAVGARRLHDINKSGWNLLWGFIPLLGVIYLIYLFVQPSDAGSNQYGDGPMLPPAS